MEPDRCIDCGMLIDSMGLLFCDEDETQCRCEDCDRDYWNERELKEDDSPTEGEA